MSWAAHEFENYFIQKHVGVKASFVAIVAGTRAQAPGATNSLQVQTVTLNSATEEERRP